MVSCSGPMALLEAESGKLTLNVSLFGLIQIGRYAFCPSQVLALEKASFAGFTRKRLRIVHTVPEYPEKIIFFGSPDRILAGIASSGFFPASPLMATGTAPRPRGFPFRLPVVGTCLLLWNLALGFAFFDARHRLPFLGSIVLIAVVSQLALSVGLLRSSRLQSLFLKPGRFVGEIRPLLMLVVTTSGFMTAVLLLLLITGILTRQR